MSGLGAFGKYVLCSLGWLARTQVEWRGAGEGKLLKFGGKGGTVFSCWSLCPQTFAECDSLLCPELTSRCKSRHKVDQTADRM